MKAHDLTHWAAWKSVLATVLDAALVLGVGSLQPVRADAPFLRGDANADGVLSVSDALLVRRWLFNEDSPPTCEDAADFNDDGTPNITDVISIVHYVIRAVDAPPPPVGELGHDPTEDDLSCDGYTIVEPEQTEDLVEIQDLEGAPGEEVFLTVLVSNAREAEAFQLVVQYDPAVFTPAYVAGGRDREGNLVPVFTGTFYESFTEGGSMIHTGWLISTSYPEESVIVLGFVPSWIYTGYELPPGERQAVIRIPGTISPEAEPGTVVRLEPTNGLAGLGFGPNGLRNELTYRGQARYVSAIPRTAPGFMRIIPDVMIFRGDSNDDRAVDLADATYTLTWLFMGGEEPRCPDAADANDDGEVNISDPIAILETLFRGGRGIAAPYPLSGSDPTVDSLGPCR
jgi:hypothetical protein